MTKSNEPEEYPTWQTWIIDNMQQLIDRPVILKIISNNLKNKLGKKIKRIKTNKTNTDKNDKSKKDINEKLEELVLFCEYLIGDNNYSTNLIDCKYEKFLENKNWKPLLPRFKLTTDEEITLAVAFSTIGINIKAWNKFYKEKNENKLTKNLEKVFKELSIVLIEEPLICREPQNEEPKKKGSFSKSRRKRKNKKGGPYGHDSIAQNDNWIVQKAYIKYTKSGISKFKNYPYDFCKLQNLDLKKFENLRRWCRANKSKDKTLSINAKMLKESINRINLRPSKNTIKANCLS